MIWTSEGFPVDNDGSADGSARNIGTATLANGTVFRVVSFGPGVSPRNHRTDSIDYATVISGEIDMELDGTSVHLKAGDLLVQRGTIHNWVNKGTAPCVIAFVWWGQSRSPPAARCSTPWGDTATKTTQNGDEELRIYRPDGEQRVPEEELRAPEERDRESHLDRVLIDAQIGGPLSGRHGSDGSCALGGLGRK